MKGTKLYQSVTHHVGIGREPRLYLLHRIACYLVPVFFMTVDDIKFTSKSCSHGRCHFKIFFRRTIPFLTFLRSYLDIKAIGLQPKPCQFVHNNRTIYPTRKQYSYPFIFQFVAIHIGKDSAKNDYTWDTCIIKL